MAKKKTTRTRTKKTGITEVQKAVNSPVQPDDPSFRVYRWDQSLRESLKERRQELGVSQRQLIRDRVARFLPSHVQPLSELGICVEERATIGPCRVCSPPVDGAGSNYSGRECQTRIRTELIYVKAILGRPYTLARAVQRFIHLARLKESSG